MCEAPVFDAAGRHQACYLCIQQNAKGHEIREDILLIMSDNNHCAPVSYMADIIAQLVQLLMIIKAVGLVKHWRIQNVCLIA